MLKFCEKILKMKCICNFQERFLHKYLHEIVYNNNNFYIYTRQQSFLLGVNCGSGCLLNDMQMPVSQEPVKKKSIQVIE